MTKPYLILKSLAITSQILGSSFNLIYKLGAERIGHGYAIAKHPKAMRIARKIVHFLLKLQSFNLKYH